LSKHRRPTRVQRLGTLAARSPLQLSVAAGVAGTLSVTGTMVAVAADGSSQAGHGTRGHAKAATASFVRDASDVSSTSTQATLHAAVDQAFQDRREAVAEAKARAERRRELAKKRAAERRAAKKAAEARTFSSASRGVERMSASAAHALAIAREAASGAYYVHGGAGPNGFDCSGFTMYVFSKMGISLPHSAASQSAMVQHVSTPQPGDLVFVYNGGGGSVGHVAIYAGSGYWYEAANPSVGVGYHRAWTTNVSYGRVL
jgi:cell wall-associated NlpC family hydrolase